MRAVVQRVASARVLVGDRVTGEIARGLVAFVGVQTADGSADVQYIAAKLAELRVFEHEAEDGRGQMTLSVTQVGGAILVVSQFTLYGDCRKGRRPSFDRAALAPHARTIYEELLQALRARQIPVATGEFQARMRVEVANDGPVTLLLDSQRDF
jgi:D-tyrosyl-tRNA(Tyr) deacylase